MNDQVSQEKVGSAEDLTNYSLGGPEMPRVNEDTLGFHDLELADDLDSVHNAYEPEVQPQKKAFTRNEKIAMVGGGLLLVCLIVGFAYMGIKLFGNKGGTTPKGVNAEQFSSSASADSGKSSANNSLQDAENLASALGSSNGFDTNQDQAAQAYLVPPKDPASESLDEGLASASNEDESAPQTPLTHVAAEHPGATVGSNAEDQAYDDIVDQASKLNVPGSAIKIDDNVVRQSLAQQGAVLAEASVQQDRKQIAELRAISSEMQNSLKSLSASLEQIAKAQEKNSKEQERVSASVAAMASDLKALHGTVDTNKKEFNRTLSDAIQRAKVNLEAKATKPVAIAKAPSVAKAPMVKPEPEVINVQLPPHQRVVTQVAPNYEESRNPPEKCANSAVSSNWRVKGINKTSAYIVRAQDGQGMIVRKDEQVPGFGSAVSFDRYSRQVCTTSGLINR